jgi:hypothetical protein
MIHYTCDLCGKDVLPRDERFLVSIEVRPAHPTLTLTEEDVDADNLAQISEAIKEREDCGDRYLEADRIVKWRFDLCLECRIEFAKDPMRESAGLKLKFSQN